MQENLSRTFYKSSCLNENLNQPILKYLYLLYRLKRKQHGTSKENHRRSM